MMIGHFKELIYNVIWRRRSVNEKQIVVVDVILYEVFLVVFLLVQSDYTRYAKLFKYFYVLFRMVPIPLISITLFNRSHECHEFAWDNPVDIAVLNALIELILLYIESSEVIPLELDRVLQSLQTLQHGALV